MGGWGGGGEKRYVGEEEGVVKSIRTDGKGAWELLPLIDAPAMTSGSRADR